MNELDMFLALPDVADIEEEVFISDRLPKFKIKPMTVEQHKEYQNRCKGKLKKNGMDFDTAKFNILLVTGQTVYPDFNNAELLKKANCTTASEFLNKKLKAGEISELADKIIELSGFENDINEDVEEAKN